MISIATERLVLERFDAALAQLIVSGGTREDFADGFPTPGEHRAGQWVLTGTGNPESAAPFLAYVVREQASGQLIGGAGFHGAPVNREAEVGYGFAEGARRKGYATECVRALVAAATSSGAVDRVVARVDADNDASRSVLRRCGFISASEVGTYFVIDVATTSSRN